MAKRQSITPELNENGMVFGENDKDKLHPFKPEWLQRVVVRQSNVERMSSGTMVEDPSSVRVKPYEAEVFTHLVKTGGFGDLKVIILHDPR